MSVVIQWFYPETKKGFLLAIIKQFMIILGVALFGEVLSFLIPLPVPASIYGIVLMLLLLITGALQVSQIKTAASFLIEIMPLMFIPAAVGLMQSYSLLLPALPAYVVITVVSTIVVMVVSGRVAQHVMKGRGKEGKQHG